MLGGKNIDQERHFYCKHIPTNFLTLITRPNCALDRSTIWCLYVPGFQRQVFKHVKILSERSKESKKQNKNKGSVIKVRNAQFGLVMLLIGFL